MFEKSLYDLIRGLRKHKGNEKAYIQNSLRECRTEIRGADMDLKATALLKLIHLEMFGHDMSWAAFHVLEVMSCQNYLQKRVGYLAAVQSFRPDTEVLMLATNLLKKDISSPLPPTISLPLVTLPHIITSSLALSLLTDLLPRLSHSNPNIRKKTVAALYRLALVYPDTLRSAWPKIKDLLIDEGEDASVTSAVVNVVCELGWRRPRDFLPLAPRLFDLLVDGGNNWMAIKIIKLFATLTPLEPRLIKKLLPPLTNLIRTTPAMSLLYECINGVIQGGIIECTDGVREGEEIASLCVGKLRSMIVVEGDPNLKYVALLAFNRIVASHPHLVSMQQDVIMSCIDDPDISIRLQALSLGAGMVNSDNIVIMVERLMQQLRSAPVVTHPADDERDPIGIEPAADSDGEDPEETLRPTKEAKDDTPALPAKFRITIIRQIIEMCSKDTYANIVDFEWYIDILVQLAKLVPATSQSSPGSFQSIDTTGLNEDDASTAIGWELRNVAVRVKMVKIEAVEAANSLISISGYSTPQNIAFSSEMKISMFAAWVVGEYASSCVHPHDTLDSLLHPKVQSFSPDVVCSYIQASVKVFAFIVSDEHSEWDAERKTMMSLLIARIVQFLEPLTMHPDLEVQERSVEFLELMRVASQAISSHQSESHRGPLLLTRAVPQLFAGFELNPVAPTAQKKVPLPDGLDLEAPINGNLQGVLHRAEHNVALGSETAEFESFYNERLTRKPTAGSALGTPALVEVASPSYQQSEGMLLDTEMLSRKHFERRERNRDDPFYIGGEDNSSGTSTPFHDILKTTNGEDVDVDAIPIMDLDLGDVALIAGSSERDSQKQKRKRPKKVHIAKDENIGQDDLDTKEAQTTTPASGMGINGLPSRTHDKAKKSLLEVDSSGLSSLSLNGNNDTSAQVTTENERLQDTEMAKAVAEVERLRLEMQRASERIPSVDGIPSEGILVKKKKRKKSKREELQELTSYTKQRGETGRSVSSASKDAEPAPIIKKKKKRRKPAVRNPDNGEATMD